VLDDNSDWLVENKGLKDSDVKIELDGSVELITVVKNDVTDDCVTDENSVLNSVIPLVSEVK
jgi:hypothetical protein